MVADYTEKIPYKCGEKFEQKNGRLGGGRRVIGGRTITKTTGKECEKDCLDNEECLSFAYSEASQHCKLHRIRYPNLRDNFRDFTWCSKRPGTVNFAKNSM